MARETREQRRDRLKTVNSGSGPAPSSLTTDATSEPPFAADLPRNETPVRDDEPAHALAPVRTPRQSDKVRTTVVLDSDEYNALGDFCRHVERETGRRGVAGSEVVRVLLGLATADVHGTIAQHVVREIGTHGGNRRGR